MERSSLVFSDVMALERGGKGYCDSLILNINLCDKWRVPKNNKNCVTSFMDDPKRVFKLIVGRIVNCCSLMINAGNDNQLSNALYNCSTKNKECTVSGA